MEFYEQHRKDSTGRSESDKHKRLITVCVLDLIHAEPIRAAVDSTLTLNELRL